MNLHLYPVPTWTTVRNWNARMKASPWTIEAIIRDGYKCVDCNNGHRQLIVHHIDESRKNGELNNSLENLATLCKPCHAVRHGFNGINGATYIEDKIKGYTMLTKGLIPQGMLAAIGKELGISRERVRQVAKKMGLIMPRKTIEIQKTKKCSNCNKSFISNNGSICCSPECYVAYRDKKYWTTVKCKQCKKVIKYRNKLDRAGRTPIYCSKLCQGKHIGKEYGFQKGENYKNRDGNFIPKAFFRLFELKVEEFSLEEYANTFNISRPSCFNDMWIFRSNNLVSKKKNTGVRGSLIRYVINRENLTKLINKSKVNL